MQELLQKWFIRLAMAIFLRILVCHTKSFFGPESKMEREEFCKVNVPSMKMYMYAENVT